MYAAERIPVGESVDRRIYTEAVDGCKLMLAVAMVGMDAGKQERAVFAWLARAAPLRAAIGEDPFASLQLDEQTIEGAIDFDDADAAGWAAVAVAAEVGSWNVRASREVWEWWLADAVPATWRGMTPTRGALPAE